MTYSVQYTSKALKQLKKMDAFDAALITSWIGKHIDGSENPRLFGKALSKNHSGEWRYRVGNYRILCLIKDDVVTVEVFTIGHRKEVYR